jgi:uncharacterized protein
VSIANGTIEWVSAIAQIPKDEWNALADQYDTPLLDWEWLYLLEDTDCVSKRSGWLPNHLTLRVDGRLIAAAPMYIKTHSVGEFVFDYAWAEVAEQLGARYYPKLVAMSPLTPAVGYRFLVDGGVDYDATVRALLEVAYQFCRTNRLGGFSILWPEPDFAEIVPAEEFTGWQHQHFLWENPGYRSFDDYLSAFNKNQRRNIRRERSSMDSHGIGVYAAPGGSVPREYYEKMFEYYTSTNDQFGMWAARYLNREFFLRLPDIVPQRLLFSVAESHGSPVGMALLLHKGGRLIGRYWGAQRFIDNLHFNVCYYTPIEWAITHGARWFDPGMGSSHKIRRGFRAVSTPSLHRFTDTKMQLVMKMNIDRVNTYEQEHIAELNSMLPFAER